MKLFISLLLLLMGTMFGCAQNNFNIPAEDFAARVKVLGVAPIFVDAESDIIHQQKELLIPIIANLNQKNEPLLVRKLKDSGSFYSVTPLVDEPRQLFSTLFSRREKRDDAGIQYNKYFWKTDEISAYIKKNRVDALMVIVVNGLTQTSKVYSGNLLASLETNFNYLMMTAQIIGSDGTILWEYPNFRTRLLTYYPLINLQYADFSESDANKSRKTEVRYKSIDGIRRALEQKKKDWLLQETTESEAYGKLFDEMVSQINSSVHRKLNGSAAVTSEQLTEPAQTATPAKLSEKPAANEPAASPIDKTPVQVIAPEQIPDAPSSFSTAPIEIVPATTSTN